jgi:hypothetical protein
LPRAGDYADWIFTVKIRQLLGRAKFARAAAEFLMHFS